MVSEWTLGEHARGLDPSEWASRRFGRNGPAQDPVCAHPGEDLERQGSEQEGKTGCAVSGVRDDEDVGVALLSLSGGNQPVEQVTQLPGCDGGGVVPVGQAKRVQRRGPVTATRLECADDRARPARDRDVLVFAPAVGVTHDPLR